MPEPKARCEYRLPPDVYLEVQRRAKACGLTNSAYVEGCLRGSWARWDAPDFRDLASAADFRRDLPLPARRRWWQRRERA